MLTLSPIVVGEQTREERYAKDARAITTPHDRVASLPARTDLALAKKKQTSRKKKESAPKTLPFSRLASGKVTTAASEKLTRRVNWGDVVLPSKAPPRVALLAGWAP